MSRYPLGLKLARISRTHFMLLLLLVATGVARAQDYVSRYDIYNGFTTLNAPHLNLETRGYHLQAGWNEKTWLAQGFDYSVTRGHDSLTPNLLPTALQQQLAAQLLPLIEAGVIPPTYQVVVPVNSTIQTFAGGPQFSYRKYQRITLFARPSIGAVHETATPHPTDPVTTVIAAELAPAGHKSDWTGFYGVGGGYDLNLTKHVGLRMQADVVYFHIFNDLLADGSWNIRWSVGPTFHFGRNIRAPKGVLSQDASPVPSKSTP